MVLFALLLSAVCIGLLIVMALANYLGGDDDEGF